MRGEIGGGAPLGRTEADADPDDGAPAEDSGHVVARGELAVNLRQIRVLGVAIGERRVDRAVLPDLRRQQVDVLLAQQRLAAGHNLAADD